METVPTITYSEYLRLQADILEIQAKNPKIKPINANKRAWKRFLSTRKNNVVDLTERGVSIKACASHSVKSITT